MPIEITMPRLSDTMESGTIIKWNVKEGDKVSAGDVIADVETDKATMEMQVYDDGTVAKLAVGEGEKVGVGTVIATLESGDAKAATKAEPAKAKKSEGAGANAEPQKTESKKRAPREPAPAPPQRHGRSEGAERGDEAPKVVEREAGQPKPGEAKTERSDDDARAPAPRAAAPSARPARRAEEDDGETGPEEEAREEASEEAVEGGKEEKGGAGRVRISPVARRLADEHEIDLKSIEGSGPGGRIIKRDILQAIEAAEETEAAVPPAARREPAAPRQAEPEAGALATRVPTATQRPAAPLAAPGIKGGTIALSSMRQTIAKRLVESKQTIPHYQVTCTFNMDPLLELRTMLNQQLEPQGVKLSVNDFLVKACALAIYEHPEFNATWEVDHLEIHDEVNIGIAISLPSERGGGLVVASIRNADHKSLRMISYESRTLADKARTRGLTIQEMSDTTFTISNLGMYGVDNFTAIINPPNAAILAVGAAAQKPVVRNDELTIGHEMSATISCDHRIIDGAMAAGYLNTLRGLLENPASVMV